MGGMSKKELKRTVFVVAPPRAYALDVVVPILQELKLRFPFLKAKFVFFREKPFRELKRNVVLHRMVSELGPIKKAYGIPFFEAYAKTINKLFKALSVWGLLLKILFSRRSILLYPRNINTLAGRIFVKANNISGKTFCYLMAATSLKENLVQCFDEKGNRRPNYKERPYRWNVADGLLTYHEDNAKYLDLQGYKDRIIIGYPMMYPAFQKRIRELAPGYIQAEIGVDPPCHTVVGIFLNKYNGNTSGRDDQWAEERLGEAIRAIRLRMPASYILIRVHPMISCQNVDRMIGRIGVERVKQTFLHTHVLACAATLIVSISQSSSGFHALAFGCPVIDYGRINDDFYKYFPEGSLYAEFGVQVAHTFQQLVEKIDLLPKSDNIIDSFQKKLGHKTRLDVFTNYWS